MGSERRRESGARGGSESSLTFLLCSPIAIRQDGFRRRNPPNPSNSGFARKSMSSCTDLSTPALHGSRHRTPAVSFVAWNARVDVLGGSRLEEGLVRKKGRGVGRVADATGLYSACASPNPDRVSALRVAIPRARLGAALSILCVPFLLFPSTASAADWPLCGDDRRVTCVVDGDTFWLNREKIRIVDLDAPERGQRARCRKERRAAERSTRTLQRLLRGGDVRIVRTGTDRYGRMLARVRTFSGDVSKQMIAAGAVRPYGWRRDRRRWCR